MRVKLCARCPYLPQDLADHYDPGAALHLCARCDGEVALPGIHNLNEAHRRGTCAIALNTLSAVLQRKPVASVAGSLA
jgi:hypothetical protein